MQGSFWKPTRATLSERGVEARFKSRQNGRACETRADEENRPHSFHRTDGLAKCQGQQGRKQPEESHELTGCTEHPGPVIG